MKDAYLVPLLLLVAVLFMGAGYSLPHKPVQVQVINECSRDSVYRLWQASDSLKDAIIFDCSGQVYFWEKRAREKEDGLK